MGTVDAALVAAWVSAAVAAAGVGAQMHAANTAPAPPEPVTPAQQALGPRQDTGAIVTVGAEQAAERVSGTRKKGLDAIGVSSSGIKL